MSVANDIQKLKNKFLDPAYLDDKHTIRQWEQEAKRAMLTVNAEKMDFVKLIRNNLDTEIDEMNNVLQNDEKATNEERNKIFFRKKLYQWFLDLFPQAQQTLAGIKKNIKENL